METKTFRKKEKVEMDIAAAEGRNRGRDASDKRLQEEKRQAEEALSILDEQAYLSGKRKFQGVLGVTGAVAAVGFGLATHELGKREGWWGNHQDTTPAGHIEKVTENTTNKTAEVYTAPKDTNVSDLVTQAQETNKPPAVSTENPPTPPEVKSKLVTENPTPAVAETTTPPPASKIEHKPETKPVVESSTLSTTPTNSPTSLADPEKIEEIRRKLDRQYDRQENETELQAARRVLPELNKIEASGPLSPKESWLRTHYKSVLRQAGETIQ